MSIAAAPNTMDALPDHPEVALDHGHAIRTVIALAPSGGQYQPADESITLKDVNYLVLQGSHDADVLSFGGISQHQANPQLDASQIVRVSIVFDQSGEMYLDNVAVGAGEYGAPAGSMTS